MNYDDWMVYVLDGTFYSALALGSSVVFVTETLEKLETREVYFSHIDLIN